MPDQLLMPFVVVVWAFFTGGLAWSTNWLLRCRARPVRIVGAVGLPIAINALLLFALIVQSPPHRSLTASGERESGPALSLPQIGPRRSAPRISVTPFRPSTPPVPPADAAAIVRSQIDQLLPGLVVFNPPTKMVVGIQEKVTVRIARGLAESTIKQRLEGRGVPQIVQVKVGTFMRVRLFGDGFNVSTHSDEAQAIADNDLAEWLYDVLPIESGKKTLTLQIAVRFKLGSSEEITNLPVLTRAIEVQVNPWWSTKTFVADNWQWFFGGVGGILASIGGFFGKRLLARHGDRIET
jgi:hypothetical protein